IYAGDRFFGSLAYTGGKVADTSLFFDEQQAVVVRVSDVLYSDADWKVLASLAGTYVFHGGDAAAGAGSAQNITLQDAPEITVDDNSLKLVSTGAINTSSAWNYGLESAVEWRSVYTQAGYFGYGLNQRTAGAPALNFDGWYAQASWTITGESRPYNAQNGAFSNPKPRSPFSIDGWQPGAWEVAARYSDLNLNDNAGTLGHAVPAGGIRGGDQLVSEQRLEILPAMAGRRDQPHRNDSGGFRARRHRQRRGRPELRYLRLPLADRPVEGLSDAQPLQRAPAHVRRRVGVGRHRPAAAQRAVERDIGLQPGELDLHQLVLRVEQRLLGLQYGQQVGNALAVLQL